MLKHQGCEYQNIDKIFFFLENLNDGAVERIQRKEAICVDSHKESADDKRSVGTAQKSNIFYF